MTPDEPEQGGQDETARYRRASATEGAQPSETVRATIFAEARRIAAEQATPDALKPFDTRIGAANQGHWKLAAGGTLAVALLGALLMVPTWRPQPATRAVAPSTRANSPPADARSARLADEAIPPVEQPPAPALSAHAESAAPAPVAKQLSQDAARRQRNEFRPLDKSTDARRDALAESAQAQGLAAAAASPPAAYSDAPRPRKKSEPLPLLQAVMSGDLAVTSGLLDRGASLDASDDYGHSALFLAVMQRRTDLVRLLLARGADAARADSTGQTPLQWAREHHFDDMVQLLSGPLATH